MEEDVALSLCELACMKVVVVVAVLFQRAWLVRCTESALPAAPPPPRLTPMESLFLWVTMGMGGQWIVLPQKGKGNELVVEERESLKDK